jgi:hypothetical protein
MLTNLGKIEILRSTAGLSDTPVGAIAVGVGTTPAAVTDEALEYEVYRVPVAISSADQSTGTIIYKAILPESLAGIITEVGAWTGRDVNEGSSVLLTFEPGVEDWAGGTWTTVNAKIGEQALVVNGGVELTDVMLDLSGLDPADTLDWSVYSAAAQTITTTLYSDDSNYVQFSSPVAAGRSVIKTQWNSVSVTGSPDVESITRVAITTTGPVTLDGLKSSITNDYNNVLVSRSLVNLTKRFDIPMEIELRINVSFTESA